MYGIAFSNRQNMEIENRVKINESEAYVVS